VITWALDRRLPGTCVQRVREGQVVLTVPACQIKSPGQMSVDAVAAATTPRMRQGVW
jgi:hypothetical protein